MNEFEKALTEAKPLLPPERWMALQTGFRAGWKAALEELKLECRVVNSGPFDRDSIGVLEEDIDRLIDLASKTVCGGAGGSGWISVGDRLPDIVGQSVDYLVCLANGDMVVAAWMNIGGWDFEPESPIAHWMPLPLPPPKETP